MSLQTFQTESGSFKGLNFDGMIVVGPVARDIDEQIEAEARSPEAVDIELNQAACLDLARFATEAALTSNTDNQASVIPAKGL